MPRMEAHILPICVKPIFWNIRFVYNALARSRLRDYPLAEGLESHHLHLVSWSDGWYGSFYGIARLVVSMDRLLRYFLKQFIRRGAMSVTTASGAKFSCGDGTGQQVAVRFLTTDAERRILLNPELGLGEVYMD